MGQQQREGDHWIICVLIVFIQWMEFGRARGNSDLLMGFVLSHDKDGPWLSSSSGTLSYSFCFLDTLATLM